MDIFTTQLTRVVPVPIKPASLKVKALLKEAANAKLSQDPDHLENHEYYFTKEDDQYHSQQQEAEQNTKKDQHAKQEVGYNSDDKASESDEKTDQKNNKPKHLDLYA